eukprot:6211-Heterococcus_DN1.PRE.1
MYTASLRLRLMQEHVQPSIGHAVKLPCGCAITRATLIARSTYSGLSIMAWRQLAMICTAVYKQASSGYMQRIVGVPCVPNFSSNAVLTLCFELFQIRGMRLRAIRSPS